VVGIIAYANIQTTFSSHKENSKKLSEKTEIN